MNTLAILAQNGTIKHEEMALLDAEARRDKLPLEEILQRHNIPIEDVLKIVGEHYHLPVRSLGQGPISHEALGLIPEESARHYRFVPVSISDGVLDIGVIDPDNIQALDALQFISTKAGMPYKLFLISEADFNRVIKEYENLTGEVGEALDELDQSLEVENIKKNQAQEVNESVIKADAPVTKIVATLLRYAVEGGASDIHVEPSPEKTRVRFRMDGDLHTSLELPTKVHPAVVARIKILCQMRLDEKRKPQDGRFSATVEGRRIDFRVSTFPTEYGEKVVMRILDRAKSVAKLDTIGLSQKDLATIREIVQAPYGIILISGPTGSGKSTTLFAMLSELDRETRNVVSIEDPVEYEIPQVAQSQVHPEIGYTFASGLRSILRQDPDVIMVGEIRDKETAQLAIQAALTGHLVLSTIHTNTAAGVIPRLLDMGVDPYLIAPTLIAAVGQRLVRQLCPGAGEAVDISDSIRILLEKDFADLPEAHKKDIPKFDKLYKAVPTPDCPNGTRGRIGVFEIMRMTKEMEEVILKEAVEEKIYVAARNNGMFTMREDAIIKALAGTIPFEEVNALGGASLSDEEEPSQGERPPLSAT